MGEGVALAAQVCWNCKNGKRKCTKELPACARCSKSVFLSI
jgi:ribosomal protein S27AE